MVIVAPEFVNFREILFRACAEVKWPIFDCGGNDMQKEEPAVGALEMGAIGMGTEEGNDRIESDFGGIGGIEWKEGI